MNNHEFYIRRCFQLAKKGLGTTGPNPLVGAVIVHNDAIIGEGFHYQAGQPHAERNAINSVVEKELLHDSTIYVNLEPCSHVGRTPACTTAIIEAGIPRVVVSNRDPNPSVSTSQAILREAGIDVTYGILESEGNNLNKRFFTRLIEDRPYIILKWAQTANGYIDRLRENHDNGIFWITQPETKTWVHQLRSHEYAILVGAQTAITDNPALTCRQVDGRNPMRIVLDPNLRVPDTSRIFDDNASVIVVNSLREETKGHVQYWQIPDKKELLPNLLHRLAKAEINSLIVEGGKTTLEHFIQANLWDEGFVLEGETSVESGVLAPKLIGNRMEAYPFGKDLIKHHFRL